MPTPDVLHVPRFQYDTSPPHTRCGCAMVVLTKPNNAESTVIAATFARHLRTIKRLAKIAAFKAGSIAQTCQFLPGFPLSGRASRRESGRAPRPVKALGHIGFAIEIRERAVGVEDARQVLPVHEVRRKLD